MCKFNFCRSYLVLKVYGDVQRKPFLHVPSEKQGCFFIFLFPECWWAYLLSSKSFVQEGNLFFCFFFFFFLQKSSYLSEHRI